MTSLSSSSSSSAIFLIRRMCRRRGYRRAVAHGFITKADDEEANIGSSSQESAPGLKSSTFDPQGKDDQRKLDTAEVEGIMKDKGVDFDRARVMRMQGKFEKEGIDPTGMPLDPKLVTFSGIRS